MTFEEAKARYVYRHTMEHVPQWAIKPAPNGKYYAPQFSSDREWYDNALFPPNNPLMHARSRQAVEASILRANTSPYSWRFYGQDTSISRLEVYLA